MALDRLADALNTIKTHEIAGQRDCVVPASTITGSVMKVLRDHNYIKNYEFVEDKRGGYYSVVLDGRINNCGVIKPRLPVKHNELAKVEEQFIPGIGVGLVILSTPQGIMTNLDAEKKHIGGRLIAYVY